MDRIREDGQMTKKMSKEEKEWLDNPTISINMVDGEMVIEGNPFDKKEKDVQSNTKRKIQREKDRSKHSDQSDVSSKVYWIYTTRAREMVEKILD